VATIDQGVELDKDGIPVAYWITDIDSDVSIDVAGTRYSRVTAENIIHVYGMDDPVQHRGEPWFAAMLPNFHKLRRYDEATIAAATVAAKFAAVLVNLNPGVVEDAGKILPTDVLEIQDGQMLVPPPGYEPKQIEPKHPSTNASDFRRDQIGSASAAAAMPVNIATQDSSRSNFASARFDGVTLAQEGEVMRQVIEDRHLTRVLADWMNEAQALGMLGDMIPEFTPIWLWAEEQRHSDPLKHANADKTRVGTGTATVGQVQMEQGYDGEASYSALVAEVKRWRADGLKHPLDAEAEPAAPAPGAPEDKEDDVEEDDANPDAE
jgi:capsid protein